MVGTTYTVEVTPCRLSFAGKNQPKRLVSSDNWTPAIFTTLLPVIDDFRIVTIAEGIGEETVYTEAITSTTAQLTWTPVRMTQIDGVEYDLNTNIYGVAYAGYLHARSWLDLELNILGRNDYYWKEEGVQGPLTVHDLAPGVQYYFFAVPAIELPAVVNELDTMPIIIPVLL